MSANRSAISSEITNVLAKLIAVEASSAERSWTTLSIGSNWASYKREGLRPVATSPMQYKCVVDLE
jgi:hypothetical protein